MGILACTMPVSGIVKRPYNTLNVTFKSQKNYFTDHKRELRMEFLVSPIQVSEIL